MEATFVEPSAPVDAVAFEIEPAADAEPETDPATTANLPAPVLPAAPIQDVPEADDEVEETATETEEERGLGWLLSLSGLGAVTGLGAVATEPDPVPVSPAPTEPEAGTVEADAPVSGAVPGRTDWFAPIDADSPEVNTADENAEPDLHVQDPGDLEVAIQEPATAADEIQETAMPAPTAQETAAQETAVQEPAVQEPAVQEAAVQGFGAREDVAQEFATQEPATTQRASGEPDPQVRWRDEAGDQELAVQEAAVAETAAPETHAEEPSEPEAADEDDVARDSTVQGGEDLEGMGAESTVLESSAHSDTVRESAAQEDAGQDDPNQEDIGREETGRSDVGLDDVGRDAVDRVVLGQDDPGQEDAGRAGMGQDDADPDDAGPDDADPDDADPDDADPDDADPDDAGRDDAGRDAVDRDEPGQDDVGQAVAVQETVVAGADRQRPVAEEAVSEESPGPESASGEGFAEENAADESGADEAAAGQGAAGQGAAGQGRGVDGDELDPEVGIWEPHTWSPDGRTPEPEVVEAESQDLPDEDAGNDIGPVGVTEDVVTASDMPGFAEDELSAGEAAVDVVTAEKAAAAEPVAELTEAATLAERPAVEAVAEATVVAVRAPSVQLPTISVAPPPEPSVEPVRRLADPEQVLASYRWVVDPVTLRETADQPEQLMVVRDRLTDKLEYAERDSVRARLLSLRAVVSRVLGEYGRALADGREALRHAEATGELSQIALVQARLAHVQHWRGDFADADRLYEEANSVELPDRLRAEMHVNAGRSGYEQGRYLEACNHFELALELRRVEDPDLVARTEFALDAVMARVQESGWGPYPRSREEILQQSRAPQPASDYETGFLGYADGNGDVVIAEQFAEAQPFQEGAAWVRRPGVAAWELIDETGSLLIDRASEYVHVGPFSDGLAWVSRADGGWFAIDWHNRVIVPGGFDEVLPFRHGLAPVRKGGWGALDRHGRVVVPTRYRGFATVLTGSGSIDGFTEEGLAVIDADDLLGVVDRAGQVLVTPRFPRLVIHPAAFVIGDAEDRWGALDRRGEPLVDVVHGSIGDVVREIERLSAETRPVL
ncbi:WG repeat-containing protein [Actinoplanes sp. NPDC051494]|uniref:WG repeat-containing protein n=1 Tax=Actinoplanes sp. NPDC051494 TaxID=3363907 RepID=UPI00378DBEFE